MGGGGINRRGGYVNEVKCLLWFASAYVYALLVVVANGQLPHRKTSWMKETDWRSASVFSVVRSSSSTMVGGRPVSARGSAEGPHQVDSHRLQAPQQNADHRSILFDGERYAQHAQCRGGW